MQELNPNPKGDSEVLGCRWQYAGERLTSSRFLLEGGGGRF